MVKGGQCHLKFHKIEKTKSAQVTVFVVIGIVLVLGIVLYFVISGSSMGDVRYSERVGVLKENLISCFSDAYGGGIDYVAYKGGYYNQPTEPFFSSNIYSIPYYYYDGEVYVPTKEKIQSEIKVAVLPTINYCLSEVSEEQAGIEWYYDDYDLDVVIGGDDISFDLDLDLSVIDGNDTFILSFKGSPILIPSKLDKMLSASNEIVVSLDENGASAIEMTHIMGVAEKYGFEIDVEEATEDSESYFYLIHQKDEQSYPYTLRFVVMHDFMEITFPEDMINIS